MSVDAESGMSRATEVPAAKPVPPAIRRWQRLRSAAIVLATQIALLAVLLGFWDHWTANDKQAAFMFGSPSAIAGFLGQMARDGSLWRDTYITGLETVLGFLVGNFFGTVVGLSLWYSRFISRVVEPFVIALGSIPIVALAPIISAGLNSLLRSSHSISTR